MGKVLRSQSIKIRVTPDEKSALLARSGGLALAEWMRDFCLGADIAPRQRQHRDPPPVAPELLRQLAQIGNNLNQLARRVNSGDVAIGDRVLMLSVLNAIGEDLAELKRVHSHDR